MAGRVTIQDIADALGVSRNTVSKAINNTGILADATRDRILKKAVEMGYKQFSYVKFANLGNSTRRPGTTPQAGLTISQAAAQQQTASRRRKYDCTVYHQFSGELAFCLDNAG